MKYKIAYYIMLASYLYLSIQGAGWKMKTIGFLLTVVNGLIFWR